MIRIKINDKKFIAMALVLLMTVPMIVSCSGGNEAVETKGTGSKDESENESLLGDDPLLPVITAHMEELGEIHNFSGETFTWVGPAGWQAPTKVEETGDIQSDALYHRQRERGDIRY